MLSNYLALDVGRARVGVALANSIAKIAAPLSALQNDDTFKDKLQAILTEHDVQTLVVGWPRGLDGQETLQTAYVGEFITLLEGWVTIPIVRQDEALTSVKAEAELRSRARAFEKGEIDSLSAVYIMEDYLADEVH